MARCRGCDQLVEYNVPHWSRAHPMMHLEHETQSGEYLVCLLVAGKFDGRSWSPADADFEGAWSQSTSLQSFSNKPGVVDQHSRSCCQSAIDKSVFALDP
jgi:hypothetical protein